MQGGCYQGAIRERMTLFDEREKSDSLSIKGSGSTIPVRQPRTLLSEQIGEVLGDFAIYSASRAGVAQW